MENFVVHDIDDLVKALKRLSPHVSAEYDFWSTREIAFLLKRSENVVRDHIVHIPDFPPAYRLPSRNNLKKSHPLWKAKEVLAWIEKHRDRA